MMNTTAGYTKLYRGLRDNPYSRDPEWVAVYVWLLLNAEWKQSSGLLNGQKIRVEPGQLITTELDIAKESGVARHKVHRVLECMEHESIIGKNSGNRNTLFTLLHWQEEQGTPANTK
jgi:hypothetical protein